MRDIAGQIMVGRHGLAVKVCRGRPSLPHLQACVCVVDAGRERVPAVQSPSCAGRQHHTEAERGEGLLVATSEGFQVNGPKTAELHRRP